MTHFSATGRSCIWRVREDKGNWRTFEGWTQVWFLYLTSYDPKWPRDDLDFSSKQSVMSELQKRQSELEIELTEATKKECTTKIEVEKLEKELGVKTEEITEGKNKIEEVEREANQIKAQIEAIKTDLELKG